MKALEQAIRLAAVLWVLLTFCPYTWQYIDLLTDCLFCAVWEEKDANQLYSLSDSITNSKAIPYETIKPPLKQPVEPTDKPQTKPNYNTHATVDH